MLWRVESGSPKTVRFLRVVDGRLEAALRGAGRQRGDRDAALVEDVQEVREPAAALAEQVALGHPGVLEGERMRVGGVPADLVVGGLDGEARACRSAR